METWNVFHFIMKIGKKNHPSWRYKKLQCKQKENNVTLGDKKEKNEQSTKKKLVTRYHANDDTGLLIIFIPLVGCHQIQTLVYVTREDIE